MAVHIPPPAIALAVAGVQWLISRDAERSRSSVGAGVVVLAGSVALAASAVDRFRRDRTTINPIALTGVSALVTTGPNAVTRNPMYVGMAGTLVAHAISRRSWGALLPVAGFVAVMDRVQISGEEEFLRERFGATYLDYCARVPRWLGPVKPPPSR